MPKIPTSRITAWLVSLKDQLKSSHLVKSQMSLEP